MSTITPWLVGSIAGVSLVDDNGQTLRAQINNGGSLLSSYTATHLTAADGTLFTQKLLVGIAGKPFDIQFTGMPVSLKASLITALEAFLASGDQSFAFSLMDSTATYSGNANVITNGDRGYLDYGPQRSNGVNIRNATLHLIGSQ